MGSYPQGPTGPHGKDVAILLPLSGPRGDVGQSMLKAAKLALDAPGAPRLIEKDTGGTPDGAARAAREAIAGGAGMILGPLTSTETAAVAPIAREAGIPVLAFTNDSTQAQPGVWTLGITPGQQVRRLVDAAQGSGKTRFSALLPEGDFGRAMGQALTNTAEQRGLPSPNIVSYGGSSMAAINAGMRNVSGYGSRRGVIDSQIRTARAKLSAEGRHEAAEIAKQSVPPPSFDSLLLADSGEALSQMAALMTYYDLGSSIQVYGPALWANPASQAGNFPGALYAAPDPASRAAFVQAYTAKYNEAPSPVADLAVDAASIARVLAAGPGYGTGGMTQPQGYAGVDGALVLLPDGQVRRSLAVFRVERGGSQIAEPAPTSFASPGS